MLARAWEGLKAKTFQNRTCTFCWGTGEGYDSAFYATVPCGGSPSMSFIGGGAQVIVFTTGRGTPAGFPFAPVIKVTGNSFCFEKMRENIDINAGTIIHEGARVESVGKEIFDLAVAAASGRKVKAEILGHDELFCIARAMVPEGVGLQCASA